MRRFYEIAGADGWHKRTKQLERDARTIYDVKIIADYHWLETSIGSHSILPDGMGHLVPSDVDLRELSAMYFAGGIVEIFDRLTPFGQRVLKGRLRDCLKNETGFAPLHLEVEMAQRLLENGFDVEFSDMEGTGQCDLRFRNETMRGEVECKSLSADAGRKIHRKDFYRFIASIDQDLAQRVASAQREIVVITLPDRLLADVASQEELRRAIRALFHDSSQSKISGSFFSVEIGPGAKHFVGEIARVADIPKDRLRAAFGQNCHVAGLHAPEIGTCLVVMRSLREDDTSKPLLEAMRRAASQLSGNCAGFIAVQFDDLEVPELANTGLRRRMGILSSALFTHYKADHISAIYFCTYGRLTHSKEGIGVPAFMVRNSHPKYPFCSPPFDGSMTDEEFLGKVSGRSGL